MFQVFLLFGCWCNLFYLRLVCDLTQIILELWLIATAKDLLSRGCQLVFDSEVGHRLLELTWSVFSWLRQYEARADISADFPHPTDRVFIGILLFGLLELRIKQCHEALGYSVTYKTIVVSLSDGGNSNAWQLLRHILIHTILPYLWQGDFWILVWRVLELVDYLRNRLIRINIVPWDLGKKSFHL